MEKKDCIFYKKNKKVCKLGVNPNRCESCQAYHTK